MEKNNLLPEEVSDLFSIATSTVRRWLKNIYPKALNRKPYKLDMEKLKKDVSEYPYGYQYERAKRLGVGQNAIFHGLKKLGISYKKNASPPKGGRDKAYIIPRED